MNITVLEYSNNIWTIEVDESVFGVAVICELELISDSPETELYEFELRNFYSTDVAVLTPYEDAQVESTIDPAKVLLWILKKIKEALCPECM